MCRPVKQTLYTGLLSRSVIPSSSSNPLASNSTDFLFKKICAHFCLLHHGFGILVQIFRGSLILWFLNRLV